MATKSKRREKQAKAEKPKLIAKSAVVKRGWSEAMISRVLGEPDRVVRNPHYSCAPPMKLFRLDRVEAAENSVEFQNGREKSLARRKVGNRVAAERRDALLAKINALRIESSAVLDASVLLEKACDHFFTTHPHYKNCSYLYLASLASGKDFFDQVSVEYLCGLLLDADRELWLLWRKTTRGLAHFLLRRSVFRTITASYPWLAEECEKQKQEAEQEWKKLTGEEAVPQEVAGSIGVTPAVNEPSDAPDATR